MKIQFMLFRLLAIGLLFLFNSSCTPDIKEQKAELGVETNPQELNKALENALGGISIANTRVGDSVTYEFNQRIELGPFVRTGQMTQTLLAIKNEDAPVPRDHIKRYIFFADEYSFNIQNGQIEDEKHVERPPLNVDLSFGAGALQANSTDCDGVDVVDENGLVYDCIKHFNLKISEGLEPAPAAVQAKPNCMGFANCMIPVKSVTYDEVKWRLGESVQTVTLTYKFAKDIPDVMYIASADGGLSGYLPPVVSFCQRTHMDYNGQDIIVTVCNVLRDFERGPVSTGSF